MEQSKPQTVQAIEALRPGFLPAPFDDIGFAWCAWSNSISLKYAGDAARLIECGAIEPDMAGKGKVKTGPRRDSAGHYFHRDIRIIRRPVREGLIVTRLITHQAFAETLPGTPRRLRFKLLDWLDAHPDRVYTKMISKEGERERRISTTGTVDTLIAAGFHKSLFEQRFALRGRDLGTYWCGDLREKHVDPSRINASFGFVYPLMRGYFEVVTYTKVKNPPEATNTKTSRAKGALRLVIDNTA